jgi:hypothetical protein
MQSCCWKGSTAPRAALFRRTKPLCAACKPGHRALYAMRGGGLGRVRAAARRACLLRSMTFCTRASTTARSAATSFSRCSALL